jgi:hypothetical protein
MKSKNFDSILFQVMSFLEVRANQPLELKNKYKRQEMRSTKIYQSTLQHVLRRGCRVVFMCLFITPSSNPSN